MCIIYDPCRLKVDLISDEIGKVWLLLSHDTAKIPGGNGFAIPTKQARGGVLTRVTRIESQGAGNGRERPISSLFGICLFASVTLQRRVFQGLRHNVVRDLSANTHAL